VIGSHDKFKHTVYVIVPSICLLVITSNKYFFYIYRIFSNKERYTKAGEKATETNEASNTAFK
jgi:hypothetical protein